MIKLELPDEAFWTAIGVIVAAIITSSVRFIKWQGIVLTKGEHDKICTKNQADIKDSLEQIDRKLNKQNETMASNHSENQGMINGLITQVAVIKAQTKG